MRAAISYSLARDKLGLARFRKKFRPKMTKSADTKSFDIVTRPVERQGIAFRNLAKEIAAIDTLEGFLGEIRKRIRQKSIAVDSTQG